MKNMHRSYLGVHPAWKESRTSVDSNVSSTDVSAFRAGQFLWMWKLFTQQLWELEQVKLLWKYFYTRKNYTLADWNHIMSIRSYWGEKNSKVKPTHINVFKTNVSILLQPNKIAAYRMDEAGNIPGSHLVPHSHAQEEPPRAGCSGLPILTNCFSLIPPEHDPPAFYKSPQMLLEQTLIVRTVNLLKLQYEVYWNKLFFNIFRNLLADANSYSCPRE